MQHINMDNKNPVPKRIGIGPKGIQLLDLMTNVRKTLPIEFSLFFFSFFFSFFSFQKKLASWRFEEVSAWGANDQYFFFKTSNPEKGCPNEYIFSTATGVTIMKSLKAFAESRKADAANASDDSPVVLDLIDSEHCPPDPLLVNVPLNNLDTKLLLRMPEEFARQMVLVEHDFFKNISTTAVLTHVLKPKQGLGGGPSDVARVKSFIAHFNNVRSKLLG